MRKYVFTLLLFLLLSLSSCKFEPKSKEKFFEEIEETTANMQDGTVSVFWHIRQNSDEFSYSYFFDNKHGIINIVNDVKDKTKYYSNKYVFENNKITTINRFYLKDELVELTEDEIGKTGEDFNKLRILEFHELNFNYDDVETYSSQIEYGMPIRYYSDILFKEDFCYKNINGYCDVVLSNVKLSYQRGSSSNYDIVGIDSAGQEVKIEILI